jgi:predicted glutamine amidotransferase
MCRMLLTIGKEADLSPYVDFLYEMANSGKNSPHLDGYGYALYTKGELTVKRSIKPIEKEEGIYGKTLLAHARKISSSVKTINNTQPFVSSNISFAHNGTIKKLETKDRSDSYIFFNMILKGFATGITNVRQREFSSINFLITDGNYAAAYREAREEMGYFSLFYRLEGDRFTVSTEAMDGKWYEIENRTLVVFRNGRVSEYSVGDEVPPVI